MALVFFPRDRARRALVQAERVGAWTWREVTVTSMAELRVLRSDDNLRKTVLRLTVDMTLPLAEYDEAQVILAELKGSMSANPRVGVLTINAEKLRPDIGALDDLGEGLPPVMQSVVRRLQEKAETSPELAERALHHLYRLVKGQ